MLEQILEYAMREEVMQVVAGAVVGGVIYGLGHIRGYVKRRAEEPQLDYWDLADAMFDRMEEKNKEIKDKE